MIAGFPGRERGRVRGAASRCSRRAVHVLPRLPVLAAQRHDGGEGARSRAAGDDRGRARRPAPARRGQAAGVRGSASSAPSSTCWSSASATASTRPAGRLQPQLPARAARRTRRRWSTREVRRARRGRASAPAANAWRRRRRVLAGCERRRAPHRAPTSTTSTLEERLGYTFLDRGLLEAALTHTSALPAGAGARRRAARVPRRRGAGAGDRRPAAGRAFPISTRATLSKWRATLVRTPTLAAKARELGIGEALRLGRGEDRGGGRDKASILASTYEAVLGAIYRDGGFERAKAVVARHFAADLERGGVAGRAGLEDHAAGAHPGATSGPCPSIAWPAKPARPTPASSPPRCGSAACLASGGERASARPSSRPRGPRWRLEEGRRSGHASSEPGRPGSQTRERDRGLGRTAAYQSPAAAMPVTVTRERGMGAECHAGGGAAPLIATLWMAACRRSPARI